jgi:TP901 family phage tail tape measure protein
MSATEKLSFMASLIDQVSGPARGVIGTMKQMQDQAKRGFSSVTQGAMGLAASGATLYGIISPAREVSKALGETRSLGVAESELQALEKTSLSFIRNYGGAADEFIRSSYDIQSAISGLRNGELAKFTDAGAILPRGTKSDAATITSYMGTMYGIFEKDAAKMGKAEWVQQLTGQTSLAVQMFKTTGSGMAEAFSTLGSTATSAKIDMSEQIGILGTLQATMSGSDAATKYKGFLNGIGQAQDALGLKFVDSQGRMLPMVNILEKIKGKFGNLDKVADSDALKKAFGSDEAVALVKNLIGKTGDLKNNISQLGAVNGFGPAVEMANAMVDPWDKLSGSVQAARIQFGQLIAPILAPMVALLSRVIGATSVWLDQHKTLGMVLGVVTLAVIGITAAVSAFAIGAGIAQIVMVAWTAAGAAYTAVQWAMNAAMAANPVGLIVIGVIALIAAVVALIANWGKLKAWLMDSALGKFFLVTFFPLIAIFYAIRIVVALIVMIFSGWVALISEVWGYLKETAFVQHMILGFTMLWELIQTIWGGIKEFGMGIIDSFASAFDWLMGAGDGVLGWIQSIISKLGDIPGLGWLKDINLTSKTESVLTAAKPIPPASPAKAAIPAGGLKNSVTSTNTKIANMGGVNIYTSAPPNRAFLEEMAHLQTGFS